MRDAPTYVCGNGTRSASKHTLKATAITPLQEAQHHRNLMHSETPCVRMFALAKYRGETAGRPINNDFPRKTKNTKKKTRNDKIT